MNNRQILIGGLERQAVFDGRYADMKCINFDPDTQEQRGSFSLVFKAFDQLEKKEVAIKFFDPTPENLSNVYRLNAFDREPEILKSLIGRKRCLQIVSSMKTHALKIPVADGQFFDLPCKYFVVEWIEEELDVFFDNQDTVETIAKLALFQQIVLAVAALHRNDVHHRDLKVDNMRLKVNELDDDAVVAIDLGASARGYDENLLKEYRSHAGAAGYASPEAAIGFCGERAIGHLNDWYAVGCLLFELFNIDLFYVAIRKFSPNLELVMAAIAVDIQKFPVGSKQKFERFCFGLNSFRHLVISPAVDGEGSSAPAAIAADLNEIVMGLTSFDYRERESSAERISNRIQICIRNMENKLYVERKKELKRQWRLNRIEKIKRRSRVLNGVKND